MTAGGYDAFVGPYCYKGTFVLKNKAGIRTEPKPQAFELEMTALRSRLRLPLGNCDPAHYRAVHHHLFQDVYTWAGHTLDFDRLDPSTFMRAMIASFHGNLEPLVTEILALKR